METYGASNAGPDLQTQIHQNKYVNNKHDSCKWYSGMLAITLTGRSALATITAHA